MRCYAMLACRGRRLVQKNASFRTPAVVSWRMSGTSMRFLRKRSSLLKSRSGGGGGKPFTGGLNTNDEAIHEM